MRILYNEELLDLKNHGDDVLIRESKMHTMQFNPKAPSFAYLHLMQEVLDDESDLIQFGQTDHIEYSHLNIGQ